MSHGPTIGTFKGDRPVDRPQSVRLRRHLGCRGLAVDVKRRSLNANMDSYERRAREIQDSIREVLIRDWDPIHVRDIPEAQHEYDGYVGGVYRLLASGASEVAIAAHLASVERESMGLSTTAEALLPVARRLKQLDVRLSPA